MVDFSKYLEYDPTSPSNLRWIVDVYAGKDYLCKKVSAGDVAGCLTPTGHYAVRVNKKLYRAHRIVYQMHHGEIPTSMVIDHKDGNPSNNNLDNLRCVPQGVNARNSAIKKSNTSGVTGVYRQITASGYDYMVAQAEVGGDVRTKSFSVLNLGLEEATRLAILCREAFLADFNRQGALFSERHGK